MEKISLHAVLFGLLFFLNACGSESKSSENAELSPQKSTQTESPAPENVKEAPKAVDPENAPVITFEKVEHDFGELTQGETVKYTFKFKNTGKSPLLIENASAPCGCTVPNWPREPILPGQDGEIKVEFNSTGKSGVQNKAVTVVANTVPGDNIVTIKAFVKEASAMNGPLKQ